LDTRLVALDTETTGLAVEEGHRIVEVGCVEFKETGEIVDRFSQYVNPEREIDEGAINVHGITNADLRGWPKFRDIADELLNFIRDADVVIHNADFDVSFLDRELVRMKHHERINDVCHVIDSLDLARERFNSNNSLDGLCKRFKIDYSHRTQHGALIDAELLARVYIKLVSREVELFADLEKEKKKTPIFGLSSAIRDPQSGTIIKATDNEKRAHQEYMNMIGNPSA